jgi:hypothetical protein
MHGDLGGWVYADFYCQYMPEKLACAKLILVRPQLCAAPCPGLPARSALLLQVLVLVSPYSWLPAWTPREKWVGGFRDQASCRSGGWGSAGCLRRLSACGAVRTAGG